MDKKIKHETDGKHVVFGSTGAYGYAIVRELEKRGKNVVAVCRDEEKGSRLFSSKVDIFQADILFEDMVSKACEGASVIYAGFNFHYADWKTNFPIGIRNLMKGCAGQNALLVFPGNVYGYGKFEKLPVNEKHPLSARSKKGIIRNRMESELIEGHRKGQFDLIIPRFADFYGPNVTNDLYGAIFRNAINGTRSLWPANAAVPHQFTFIDDAAVATMDLVENPESYGEAFHVCGETISARDFITKIYSSAGKHPEIRVVSKPLMALVGIFNSQAREILELLYEYSEPYVLDDSKFRKFFPSFKYTNYENGIRETLAWFRSHETTA